MAFRGVGWYLGIKIAHKFKFCVGTKFIFAISMCARLEVYHDSWTLKLLKSKLYTFKFKDGENFNSPLSYQIHLKFFNFFNVILDNQWFFFSSLFCYFKFHGCCLGFMLGFGESITNPNFGSFVVSSLWNLGIVILLNDFWTCQFKI